MSSILFALAMRARADGDRARAESLLREALDSDETEKAAQVALGVLCEESGRLGEAVERYERAYALDPADAVVGASLGHVLARLGRFDRALGILRAAAEADPKSADTLASLGGALSEAGRSVEAVEVLRRALALAPDHADALNGLGNALHLLGRPGEAIDAYRAAVAAKPDFAAAHSNLIYTLSLDPRADAKAHQAEREAWWLAHGAAHAAEAARPHALDRDPDRRLRIGYVSGHFRRESAANSFAPVLFAHDPGAVELAFYSGTERTDDLTAAFRGAASLWRETAGLDDAALAQLIRGDRVDILVDLAGHMYGNRLPVFARKPAPIQISAWGEPTGTGLRTMDALFSDPVHIPKEVRRLFAETVVDLPCHIHYARPPAAPPVSDRSRHGDFVFGSLNRMAKLGERTLALWRRVLDAVPKSRLLLKDTAFDEPTARAQILAVLGHPERVDFKGGTSQAEHLAAYAGIDLALDPTPQNGGVTTFEALWMGIPAIALLGSTPASRTSAAILSAAGLGDLVAATEDAYVALAKDAATVRERLVSVGRRMPAALAASPPGNSALYARAVEAEYRRLWRAWASGT
jgi:predicted O-linked N-acetylglucosamine transferase (SPINDLY family)